MRQPKPVLTLLALCLAAATSFGLAPGCDGGVSVVETGGSGGTGGGTTTMTGVGAMDSTTTPTINPLCTKLCMYLEDIQCNVLKDCAADCNNHLNAPPDCTDEADQLIDCWVKNLKEFKCTMLQVLPPAACQDEEKTFNDCVGVNPTASCICSPGVGSGDKITNCTRKTNCATQEYRATCEQLVEGEPWTCSCFANDALLGTCSEASGIEHCSNDYGCCVPLFCAATGE